MKNINENWMKEKIQKECKIEKLKRIEAEILKCSEAYRDVFNGSPFYESWTLESALEEINNYVEENALVLVPKIREEIVGFLVAMNGIPENQKSFVSVPSEKVKFIEEVGVLEKYRGNLIASEMVRILLLNLKLNDNYLAYRTNAMRYFELNGGESFESGAMRTQKEDFIKRKTGEKIIIPDFSESEKQAFINKYIELIKYRPDLDVSNSNALFRSIFGLLDYSMLGNNYAFQKDPTGEGNDRIFPIVDIAKTKILK